MHKIGCKADYFKYDDVSMLGLGCGDSKFPQFYENIYIYINYWHFHMWEVMRVKRVTNF